MQINRDYEPEINLKNAFFHVLYRWRSILLFALIGAIALGAYQYFSVKSTHDAGKLTKDERQYQLDLQSYKEELQKNQNITETYTKLTKEQREYQRDSVYYKLDPEEVWQASCKYLVKVDSAVLETLPTGTTMDPADSILSAYTAAFSGLTDDQELTAILGTKKAVYINEMVNMETDLNTNTLSLSAKGATKEAAQSAIGILKRRIEAISQGKAQEVNSHQLIQIDEDTQSVVDNRLKQKKIDLATNMSDYQKMLQEARTKLDELEAKEGPAEPGDHVKKMAAIGFIVGAFLLAGLYLFGYVLNGRLNDSSTLTEQYGLPVFGEFSRNGSLHHGRTLDRLIAKWETGHQTSNPETIYDRTASLIEEQGKDKNLLLLSTLPEEKLQAVREALVSRLPDKIIKATGSFQENGEAVAEAAKADTVVLVEEKGVSRQKEIDSMAEALIIAKANVISAIIL